MSESNGMLRHLAFFEELGRMDESDASWRSVSAGLVVMRLVDQWIEDGPSVSRIDSWAVSAVREAITAVAETTPVRRILTSVVDVMVTSTAIDLHALSPRLMAYGQALEYDAKWSLAADVYQTIAEHAHPTEDADLAIGAHLQLAFCLRTLGDLDAAGVIYSRASSIALAANDMMGALRARLGDAKIAMARGNLPEADAIVDETLTRANTYQLNELRARALNERTHIAGLRGQHDRVIRFAYESLQIPQGQQDRDRALSNIATAFRFLGLIDVARDAYLVLAATAQEQYVRWMAGLNLLEVAAQEGQELQFDRYRRDFESAEFTPFLRVTYLLHVGRGYQSLGHAETGTPYLRQAIELAAKHQFNQLMFEAESALADVSRRGRRSDEHVVEVDEELQAVIDAVHGMRTHVGA